MVLWQRQDHLKRAVALDQRSASPMERLIAPSATGSPLGNPLNIVRAVDDAEVSLAGCHSLIAFMGLLAAIDRGRSRGFLLQGLSCSHSLNRSLLLPIKKALEGAGTNWVDEH